MFMMAYVIVIYIPPWGVVDLHIGVRLYMPDAMQCARPHPRERYITHYLGNITVQEKYVAWITGYIMQLTVA